MNSRSRYYTIAVIAALMASVAAVPANAAYTPSPEGMELVATSNEGSSIVHITGKTIRDDPIIFQYMSPSHNLVKLDQINPSLDGTFATTFNVAGLSEDGMYRVVASQGEADLYKLEVNVPVNQGAALDLFAVESNFERAEILVGHELFPGDMIGLTADAMEGSDIISVSGQTDITNMPLTVMVIAPNGNIILADQIQVDMNGLFATDIQIGGSLWSQDGVYMVTAEQDMPGYITSVNVDVADGLVVPEFGTIAALILALAVVSIVAVSARSRLSIAPRF